MAKENLFHCTVITPERKVLECEARFAAFPAHDGEMGIMPNRAPIVCKLGVGELRVETGSDRHRLFIDGGFAQMIDNRLTLLTEQARPPEKIVRADAQAALAKARAMPITDDASFAARQHAIASAKAQIEIGGESAA